MGAIKVLGEEALILLETKIFSSNNLPNFVELMDEVKMWDVMEMKVMVVFPDFVPHTVDEAEIANKIVKKNKVISPNPKLPFRRHPITFTPSKDNVESDAEALQDRISSLSNILIGFWALPMLNSWPNWRCASTLPKRS